MKAQKNPPHNKGYFGTFPHEKQLGLSPSPSRYLHRRDCGEVLLLGRMGIGLIEDSSIHRGACELTCAPIFTRAFIASGCSSALERRDGLPAVLSHSRLLSLTGERDGYLCTIPKLHYGCALPGVTSSFRERRVLGREFRKRSRCRFKRPSQLSPGATGTEK